MTMEKPQNIQYKAVETAKGQKLFTDGECRDYFEGRSIAIKDHRVLATFDDICSLTESELEQLGIISGGRIVWTDTWYAHPKSGETFRETQDLVYPIWNRWRIVLSKEHIPQHAIGRLSIALRFEHPELSVDETERTITVNPTETCIILDFTSRTFEMREGMGVWRSINARVGPIAFFKYDHYLRLLDAYEWPISRFGIVTKDHRGAQPQRNIGTLPISPMAIINENRLLRQPTI
jgi:hypothetical protein